MTTAIARWRSRGARVIAAALLLSLVASFGGVFSPAHAQQGDDAATVIEAEAPAELVLVNRPITTLRATAYGAAPSERVAAVQEGLAALLDHGGPLVVSTRPIPEGVAVLVDGKFAFRVLHGDVNREAGETTAAAAAAAVSNLQLALDEIRESRDSETMLKAIGYSLAATVVLAGLLWLIGFAYRLFARRVRAAVQRRSEALAPSWSQHVVGRSGLADLAIVPVRLVAWAVVLLLVYEWAALVLQFFPYTRPWGESLLANLLGSLGGFARGILDAVPGLLFVALIFLVTRFVVRVVRAFFDGVQSGRIPVGWIDDTTARPTGRLLIALSGCFRWSPRIPTCRAATARRSRALACSWA